MTSTVSKLKTVSVTKRIREAALQLLASSSDGLRYSELHAAILAQDPKLNPNTINGCIWNLDTTYPKQVYKPSRGLFRSTKFKSAQAPSPAPVQASKIHEDAFYKPFADWLVNDVEDATKAIPLGRNLFKDKWGTPDVLGKLESKRSDIIKTPTEIIAAEIKIDTQQLVTAFGQACAYRIFSHKSYLVVPRSSPKDELARLDALAQIFGIGLVIFSADKPQDPDFRIRVRATKHDPDMFYTNKYMQLVEKELFA